MLTRIHLLALVLLALSFRGLRAQTDCPAPTGLFEVPSTSGGVNLFWFAPSPFPADAIGYQLQALDETTGTLRSVRLLSFSGFLEIDAARLGVCHDYAWRVRTVCGSVAMPSPGSWSVPGAFRFDPDGTCR
jgi:hypothetical protein